MIGINALEHGEEAPKGVSPFQRGHISQEDCLGSLSPAQMRGSFSFTCGARSADAWERLLLLFANAWKHGCSGKRYRQYLA
jgi:hypothetical protein